MRGLLLLIAITVGALWWGGHHILLGLKDRNVTEMTCADYVTKHPDAHWVRLTKCVPDIANMAIETTTKNGKDEPKSVYLPLYPEGTDGGAAHIVVHRTDDELLELGEDHSESMMEMKVSQAMKKLDAAPVEGVVQFGIDLSDSDRSKLSGLGLGLANDFVIIEYGAKPKLLWGLLAFGVGLLSGGFLLFRIIRRFKPARKQAA